MTRSSPWLIYGALLLPAAVDADEGGQQASRAKLMTQTGHANSLGLLSSISPNGNLVATADSSVIKIWNADLGRLVCELKPQQAQATAKPTSRRSKASDEEHDGQAGSAFSFAWSGDSQSLYVPYGDRLVRQDLIRCAEAETLQVRLPDPRQGARQPEDPQRDPIEISEVSTLQNGKILIRTRSGLYLAEIQANRVRAEVLSHIEQKKQKLDPSKLDFKDIISGKGMEGLMDMLMDSLQELKIGAHSADGSVVALTARTITLGPMMLPMSRAETLLSINGSLVPLSSFQGAAPSYKGVSLAAVSAQGKWLAVRAGAQQGAEISLFDLQQRRLVKRFTVNYKGGAKPADSPLSAIIQPLYEQDTAVAGMAFSPDEQQLLLLRNRRDAGERHALN
jgi:WD40 repeat protein